MRVDAVKKIGDFDLRFLVDVTNFHLAWNFHLETTEKISSLIEKASITLLQQIHKEVTSTSASNNEVQYTCPFFASCIC